MSTSYPYLQLARKCNLPYGQVLCYADYLDKTANGDALSPTWFETEAATRLNLWARSAVHTVWQEELRRRQT